MEILLLFSARSVSHEVSAEVRARRKFLSLASFQLPEPPFTCIYGMPPPGPAFDFVIRVVLRHEVEPLLAGRPAQAPLRQRFAGYGPRGTNVFLAAFPTDGTTGAVGYLAYCLAAIRSGGPYVFEIFVRPAYRQHGICSALLHHLLPHLPPSPRNPRLSLSLRLLFATYCSSMAYDCGLRSPGSTETRSW